MERDGQRLGCGGGFIGGDDHPGADRSPVSSVGRSTDCLATRAAG